MEENSVQRHFQYKIPIGDINMLLIIYSFSIDETWERHELNGWIFLLILEELLKLKGSYGEAK